MMKVMRNFFIYLLGTSVCLVSSIVYSNDENMSTRFSCSQVIHLTQRDFDSGTYRIKTPATYILDTHIDFDPLPSAEATRTDKPITGWFAAITVETDNVIIDLNGKTIQASQHFLDTHIFNIFADIELDNGPFSGPLFGLVGAFFPGDTTFVAAQNVEIKNGVLGRTSHWCLHGNNNTNISVHDIHAKDFEVAGIELNGLMEGSIREIKITGLEHIIRVTPLGSAAFTLIKYLTQIAAIPDPCFEGAAEHLAALQAYVLENPVLFNEPLTMPQGSMYGLFLANGFTLGVNFPVTPEDCAIAAFFSGGRTLEHVHVENILIEGIKSAPKEFILIGSQVDGTVINLSLLGLPIFGVLAWDTAFDEHGNFAPDPLLRAQIFVVNTQLCLFPDSIPFLLPPNYEAIAESIRVSNELQFLENTFPVFGQFLDQNLHKGTFGVRVDCAMNNSFKNIAVHTVENNGLPGLALSDIPAGFFYEGVLPQFRYAGNDSWGFEFGNNADTSIDSCNSRTIVSVNGDAFGLDLINSNMGIPVKRSHSKAIKGLSDTVSSEVNTPSSSYGFRVLNNSGPISFVKCSSKEITAPRFAFGFAAEESDNVTLEECSADHVSATSSQHLSLSKQAFGFDLEQAQNTLLKCIAASHIAIKGEKSTCSSASIAAGIAIDNESDASKILCPSICHIQGGAGHACKILDEGTNTRICKNTCKKHSTT